MTPIVPRILIAASLYLLTSSMPVLASADDPLTEEAKQIIKEFSGQLQSELKAAIESGGPVGAISVCKDRSPAIAAELSEASGWEVGRVSLKTRNTKLGTPDAWETRVLESFKARLAEGQPAETLSQAEVVEDDQGRRTFRFMKAIPTQEVCLACHGKTIAAPVAQALDEHYPNDRARGFEVGDIRGAFTLSKPLTE
ncbi:Tll0287-like domain-containing protein [Thermochromatium tepidum]|uniref:DUF3365 domain-containing protein n=1 Tax=Thermochromatium tepidum ATCC 43061 TaxID=316276 RepID=A0A6I6EAZ8_THETI|nr:DUF3365 domain-containing protein [Thermochromatium tepidum]QGU32476.1 DUF3365 domain-containing protein [Thermochromatium tepidum ATCC 43061]